VPVITTANGLPPEVGESTVLGHPPAGAGTMSAGRLSASRSALPETRCLTYGFVFDAVRWQIVVLVASVRAFAVVSALPATPSIASNRPIRFMSLLRPRRTRFACLSPGV